MHLPAVPAASSQHTAAQTQVVTWFELFYDLIIVAAVSQAGKVFVKSPDWDTSALITAAVLVLFTVWLLTTLSHGTFPGEHVVRRVLVLVQMFAIIVAALAVGKHGLPNGVGFASLAVAFASLAVLYAVHGPRGDGLRAVSRRVAVALAIAAAAFVGCAVAARTLTSAQAVHVAPLLIVVGIAIVAVPVLFWFLGAAVRNDRIDLHHIEERFGLLVIIVLGESFINLIGVLGFKGYIPSPVFFVLTFVVTYAVWSVYFSSVLPAGTPTTARGLRAWAAGHALLVLAWVAVASAFSDLTLTAFEAAHDGAEGRWSPLPMLAVVVALALLTRLARATDPAMLRVHLIAIGLLVALTLGDLFLTAQELPWFTLLAALVLLGDAIACTVLRMRGGAAPVPITDPS